MGAESRCAGVQRNKVQLRWQKGGSCSRNDPVISITPCCTHHWTVDVTVQLFSLVYLFGMFVILPVSVWEKTSNMWITPEQILKRILVVLQLYLHAWVKQEPFDLKREFFRHFLQSESPAATRAPYKKKKKTLTLRSHLTSHNHHHHQARLPWLFLKQPLYLWHTSWILAVRKRQTQMALRARRLQNSQLPVDSSHAASKQERRTHRTEVPHLSWLARLRWPCRPLLLAKRVILKIHFSFLPASPQGVKNVEVGRRALQCEEGVVGAR